MKKFLFVLAFLGFIVACSEKVNPDDGGKPQDKDISGPGVGSQEDFQRRESPGREAWPERKLQGKAHSRRAQFL